MDNNLAERALRGPAAQIVVRLQERNWLGCSFPCTFSWSLAAPSRLFAGLRRTQRTAARGRACLASLGCGPCGPCPHLARRCSAGAMSYCGRDFSEDELDPGQRNGIPPSNALPCRASCANAWRKPNGGLRVLASRCCAWNVTAFCRHADPPASFVPSRDRTAAGPRPSGSSAAYPSTKEGKLWNAGHYLGFTPGSQHFVRSAEGEPLAMLGFGAAEDRTASSWERRQRTFRRQQREVTALGQNQTPPCPRTGRAMFARRLGPPLRSASSTA